MNNEPMEIMSSQPPEIRNAICFFDPVCRDCGRSFKYEVSITSIQAQGPQWELRGVGRLRHATTVPCRCPLCAAMFSAIMYRIPIECAPFPCPQCSQIQKLEYKIQRIQVENDAFQFEATITCRKCGNAKSFKEVLKKIMGVLKITVGPTGITVSQN